MAIMTAIPLSSSSGGRPVPIIATSSPGTTIHTLSTATGVVEEVYLDIYNITATGATLQLEAGSTATLGIISIFFNGNSMQRVLAGARYLAATGAISAYATATNVFQALGGVNKATP